VSFDTRLLNGLNVLAAIVEADNFFRAGEALGLTQSGPGRTDEKVVTRYPEILGGEPVYAGIQVSDQDSF
jgi:hypothetical protein